MGSEVDLWGQHATNIYCLLQGNRLCRRLDGPARSVGSGVFVPIEVVETGWRQLANLRHLTMVNEMEVIAWAVK